MSTVMVKSFTPKRICDDEIFRYAGVQQADKSLNELLQNCKAELEPYLKYLTCYAETPVCVENDVCDLGFAKVKSKDLAKRLEGCQGAAIFAATLGTEVDRIIKRALATSPSKAVMLDAVGNERIEALCDAFCKELEEQKQRLGLKLKNRFSAGYGDLELNFQKQICSFLNTQSKIGLSLANSLLMTPSKSVTAIVGIYKA